MARKKTREQKIQSAKRKEAAMYTLPGSLSDSPVSVVSIKRREVVFGYDLSLLIKDIRKTLFVSAFILILELLTYWQLH